MGGLYIIGWMHVIMTCWYRSDGLSDGAELKADFCTNSTRGKECLMLYHLPSKITWNEATEFCTSVDSVLASILDSHIQENMRAVFQSASIDSSSVPCGWIGGREQNDDTWMWLDGSLSKFYTSIQTSGDQTCAYLSMVGDAPTLQPVECRLTKSAFLCTKKYSGCIGEHGFSSVEIYISNTSYCSYAQGPAISWYEANNVCQQYGGMVASLPFLTESRVERWALMANLTSLHNEDTWIGLRRRRWKWEFIQELITEAPALFMYTHWRSGEPNDADQSCSYVDRWDKWADESCTKFKLLYTICQNITNIATIAKTAVSSEVQLRNHTRSGTTDTPQGSREAIPADNTTSVQPQTTNHEALSAMHRTPSVAGNEEHVTPVPVEDDTIIIISTLFVLVTVVLLVVIIFLVFRRKPGRNGASRSERAHDLEITEITRTTRNSNNTDNNGISQNYEEPGLEANASPPHEYADLTSSGYANVDNEIRPIYEELSRNEYENVNTNTEQNN